MIEYRPENIELIKALIKFKQEVGIIKETCTGQTGNRTFSYADLEDIWDCSIKPLTNNGLLLQQYLQQHETGVHLHTDLYHVSGACLTSDCLIDYEAKDIKDHGGNISYFRRYTQLAMLGLVPSDKAEKNNVEDKPNNTFTKIQSQPTTNSKTVALDPVKKLRDEVSGLRARLTFARKTDFDKWIKGKGWSIDTATQPQLVEIKGALEKEHKAALEEKRNVA
jgi:hypothetical protein